MSFVSAKLDHILLSILTRMGSREVWGDAWKIPVGFFEVGHVNVMLNHAALNKTSIHLSVYEVYFKEVNVCNTLHT